MSKSRLDHLLGREIDKTRVPIDGLWQPGIEVERKQEFYILLRSRKPNNPALAEAFYHGYPDGLLGRYGLQDFAPRIQRQEGTDLELLPDLCSAAPLSIIESIHSSSFEILELRDKKIPIEAGNSRRFSIAIFLQLTGLILVLARAVHRR